MLSLYCGKATQAWWESQLVGTVSGLLIGVLGTCLTQYLAHRYTIKLEINKAKQLFVNNYFVRDILEFIDKEVLNFQKIHKDYYHLAEGEELGDDLSHRERAALVMSSIAMFKDEKLTSAFERLTEHRNVVITSHLANKHQADQSKQLTPKQLQATVEIGIALAAALKLRLVEICSSSD